MVGKIRRAVFDTGPFIHLNEIGCFNVISLFNEILIPPEVFLEINKKITLSRKLDSSGNVSVVDLDGKAKDMSVLIVNQYFLDLGEAEAIALSLQKNPDVFITDDLEARVTAKHFGVEVHGTIGVLLRAYREKLLSKEDVIAGMSALYDRSSLFVTKDLVRWAIAQIDEFEG